MRTWDPAAEFSGTKDFSVSSVGARLASPKKSARGIRPVRVNARLAVDAVEGEVSSTRHSWAGSVNWRGSGSSDRRLPWGTVARCGVRRVEAQEVKLDGVAGVEEKGGITSAPRSALEHSAATFSSVDSLIVRIVHAGLSDAGSSGGRKSRERATGALLSL